SCADDDVMFAIQTDREWRRFCGEVMEQPDLADDPRFVTNAERLKNRVPLESLIDAHFRKHPRASILRRLEQSDIPTGAVNDVPSVAKHPQLAARGRWANVGSEGGDFPALKPPHNLGHVAPRMGRVPALGEHTQEILAELRRP